MKLLYDYNMEKITYFDIFVIYILIVRQEFLLNVILI